MDVFFVVCQKQARVGCRARGKLFRSQSLAPAGSKTPWGALNPNCLAQIDSHKKGMDFCPCLFCCVSKAGSSRLPHAAADPMTLFHLSCMGIWISYFHCSIPVRTTRRTTNFGWAADRRLAASSNFTKTSSEFSSVLSAHK